MNAHPNFPLSRQAPACPLADLEAKASKIIARLDEIDVAMLDHPDAIASQKLQREQATLNAELEAIEAWAPHIDATSADGALFLLAQLQSQVNAMGENANCDISQRARFDRAELLSELLIHGLRRYLLDAGGSESRALEYYLDGDLDPRRQITVGESPDPS